MIVASNAPVPHPQTAEHLAAAEIMGLKQTIVVQTKIDLVKSKDEAVENYNQIQAFKKGKCNANSFPSSSSFSSSHYYLVCLPSVSVSFYCSYLLFLDYVGTIADASPVVPICCSNNNKYNIDVLLEYLCEKVPLPVPDLKSNVLLTVIRSFDVNNPGDDIDTMKGGVAGGTIQRGVLRIGKYYNRAK